MHAAALTARHTAAGFKSRATVSDITEKPRSKEITIRAIHYYSLGNTLDESMGKKIFLKSCILFMLKNPYPFTAKNIIMNKNNE